MTGGKKTSNIYLTANNIKPTDEFKATKIPQSPSSAQLLADSNMTSTDNCMLNTSDDTNMQDD